MRRELGWGLTFVLIILVPLSGCNTSRQSLPTSSVMHLWSTYTHCYRSADLEAMRDDVQQLSQAVNTIDSTEDSSPTESHASVPSEPTTRLSVDPTAMAASCTLHAGQTAEKIGNLSVAREMFQLVVLRFPQSGYQYYTDQALLGLEQLDAASRDVNRPIL